MNAIPRLTTLSLTVAIVCHLHATVVAMVSVQQAPAWQWALLTAVEASLLVLAWANPRSFTTRDFRLPGVFVSAMAIFVLAPLPFIVRRYGDLVPESMILAIALGMLGLGVVLGVGLRLPTGISASPHQVRGECIFPLAIIGAAIVLLPVWLRSLPIIPIVAIFRGVSGIDAALARDAALSSLPNTALRVAVGSIRNLYLVFAVGWTVAAAVVARRRTPERRKWVLIAVCTVGLASAYALITTERLVVGQVVLVAIVAAVCARGRALTMKQALAGGTGLIIFPIVFGLRAGVGGLSGTLAGLRRRAFYVTGDVLTRYFIEFPSRTPFIRGASIPKVSRVTGRDSFDLAGFIYARYFQRDTPLAGNANASFLGVGWANFGTAGVILWSVAVGVGLVVVERVLRRLPRRAAAAARAVAVFQVVMLTFTDITRALLGFAPGFLDLIVILWVLHAVDGRLRLRSAIDARAMVPASA